MKPGLFAILLAIVVGIAYALAPMGSGLLPAIDGQPITALAAPRCLSVSYAPGFDTASMPRVLRLDATSVTPGDSIGRTNSARSDEKFGLWRYAGADSIDVEFHHLATFRLPLDTSSRTGRVQPYWSGTVLMVWLERPAGSTPVTLRNIACTDSGFAQP